MKRPARCRLAALISLLVSSQAFAAAQQPNLLGNPGFEQVTEDRLATWTPYGLGCTIAPKGGREGGQGIKCVCRSRKDITGVSQVIQLPKPVQAPIVVTGWSKAKSDDGGGEYAVYLDIIYTDGTPLWGQQAQFERGPHDWQQAVRIVRPAKPVKEIRVYVLYRRAIGTVWFDDIAVTIGSFRILPVFIGDDWPRRDNAIRIHAEATDPAEWTATILDDGGRQIRTHQARGPRLRWIWDGKNQAGKPQPGGTYVVRLVGRKTGSSDASTFERRVTTFPRPTTSAPSDCTVWVESSMTKVLPGASPPSTRRRTINLALAGNEVEGAQVVIRPRIGLTLRDVVIETTDLRSKGGQTLPASQVSWRQVGYVRLDTPSGHPIARPKPGWYPDPLLEVGRFDVQPGMAQAVWVNVRATEKTPPGTYEGQIRIKPANAPATTVTLTVTVWPFILPTQTHLKTAFCMMDGFLRRTYGPITPALRRSALDIMLDHRLNPDDISRTDPPAIADLEYARGRGMNAFNVVNLVPKPTNPVPWVCYSPLEAYTPAFKTDLARRLDAYMAKIKRRGLIDKAYFYGFDERGPEYRPVIKELFGFLKQRYPGVRTLTTAGFTFKHDQWRDDNVDWYCPLSSVYDLARAEMMRQAGKQVWWYVCCGPRYPYANFSSFDYPTIEARLLFWMTFKWRVDGVLFWHVNHWPASASRLDGADPFVDWPLPHIWGMTGDGVLTYPGRDELLSSIRLENIRDGIEDYEYLALLARSVGRERAERICTRLCPSMTEFSRNPQALRLVRTRVARLLSRASRPTGGREPKTRR